MSLVNFTPIIVGDAITAASLNTRFDNFAAGSVDLSAPNFRTDTFDSSTLSKSSIVPFIGFIENASVTIKTYTGTAYQDVDTNGTDMNTGNITVEDGDVLIIHWRQLQTESTANTPSLDYRTRYQLHWRPPATGSYVIVPETPTWAYSGYSRNLNALKEQNLYISAAGSVAIPITFSGVITGVKLMVKPGTNASDNVDLQYGLLSSQLYRR